MDGFRDLLAELLGWLEIGFHAIASLPGTGTSQHECNNMTGSNLETYRNPNGPQWSLIVPILGTLACLCSKFLGYPTL